MAHFCKQFPVIPASLDGLQQLTESKNSYAEKFDEAAFGASHQQLVAWIREIHDETLQKKVAANRRADMSYEVQYDDERLKLAVRPLIGSILLKKTAAAGTATQNIVKQLVQLEQGFDWMEYYKLYNNWFKEVRAKLDAWDSKNRELSDKIPLVQTAYGLQKDEKKEAALSTQLITEKLQIHKELYEKQYTQWTNYFRKYSKLNLELQQLLQKINYGKDLSAEEKKILLPALADVQARGLESLEKIMWQGIVFLSHGQIWAGEKMVAEYYFQ